MRSRNKPTKRCQTLALIDGDIICYRCAAVCEDNDAELARWQADELVTRILADTGATGYKVFLSGENNFRYEIYPEYKAHRRDKPKPKHLEFLREHLLVNHPSDMADGIEADDSLGIESYRLKSLGIPCIIASLDKDLLQLAGLHYNFVRREIREIGELEGWKNFYLQLLIGDPADNIPGCPGIGKVKAPKVLLGTSGVSQMYMATLEAYTKANVPATIMHRNAQLLYLKRAENDEWTPPKVELEAVPPSTCSESSKDISLEPTTESKTSGSPCGGTLMGMSTTIQT